jgi:hypothetical protein
MYKVIDKSWVWMLTFPFAHNNVTAFGNTIYKPKGLRMNSNLIAHEKIHLAQQRKLGKWKYLFLYLFCCPFFWNPWRYKWEMEAYTKGSKFSKLTAKKLLQSSAYGWLV